MSKLIKGVSICLLLLGSVVCNAQPSYIIDIFPKQTQFIKNVPYANDTIKKHLLDIYLPAQGANFPLVIWIHGGGWRTGDKYADMGYMKSTLKNLIDNGYAVASIDYSQSTSKTFPTQIQECNQAINFLTENIAKYKLDKSRFALMGFSAGGHLASLLALSLNDSVKEFLPNGKSISFKIKAVVDFYGPSDLLSLSLIRYETDSTKLEGISIFLGGSVMTRPDVAKRASPVEYIDKNDPPFLIIHGEKDDQVPVTQSKILHSFLIRAGVKSKIKVVKDAPHYGVMFDSDSVQNEVFNFLKTNLR